MNEFFITINVTNRCNLSCPYCMADAPYNVIHDDISITLIKYIIKMVNDYLFNYKIRICLVGGEPLVYPHLDKVITMLYEIKHISRIYICTNNTLSLPQIIQRDIPIHYAITYHADLLVKNQIYHKIFLKNLEYIQNNNYKYNIVIMQTNNIMVKDANKLLDELFERLTPEDEVHRQIIISTPHYKSQAKINNECYNKYVYPYRHINITRNIIQDKLEYIFSYTCEISNQRKYKNIFHVKDWRELSTHYNEGVVCTSKICICNIGCKYAK